MLESLEARCLLSIGPTLVEDIDQGSAGSAPDHTMFGRDLMVELGGAMIFSADNGSTGQELWSTSGVHSGTALIKNIRAGALGSDPDRFTRVGTLVYFSADDGVKGRELWVTDGTAAGTHMVSDIKPGALGSNPSQQTAVGDRLFFRADGDPDPNIKDEELWIIDGPGIQPRRIRDINKSGSSAPQSVTPMGNWVYFVASDGSSHGKELWRTDGTSANTNMVKDIFPGAQSALPRDLTVVDNVLYFSAEYPVDQRNLWKSNGQLGNATKVDWEFFDHAPSDPRELTAGAGTLYFTANVTRFVLGGSQPGASDFDEPHGRELAYLPSGATTWKYVDIRPGAPSAFTEDNHSGDLTFFDRLYFAANDGTHGREPWTSNGTAAGTKILADLRPEALESDPAGFTRSGGKVVFSADSPASEEFAKRELFVTDGTSPNTQQIAALAPELMAGSNPLNLTAASGGVIYFRAATAATGEELWKYSPSGINGPADIIFGGDGDRQYGAELAAGAQQDLSAEFNLLEGWYDPLDVKISVISLDPDKIAPDQVRVERTDDTGKSWRLIAQVRSTATGIARLEVKAVDPVGSIGTRTFQVDLLPDQDGDGLPDLWETRGVDVNRDGIVDLILSDADPKHKDLYLEIDAMRGQDFSVLPQAKAMMVSAFANAPAASVKNPDGLPGVDLHAEVDETDIPVDDFTTSGFDTEFAILRSLGTKSERDLDRVGRTKLLSQRTLAESQAVAALAARELVYRYQLLGRSFLDDLTLLGLGELPGDDSVVTLGRWKKDDAPPDAEPNSGPDSAEQLAGVMMHEFGHNLGLGHGGGIGVPETIEIQSENFGRRNNGNNHQWAIIDLENPGPGGFSGATGKGQDFLQSLNLSYQDTTVANLAPVAPSVEYDIPVTDYGIYDLKLRVAGLSGNSDSLWVEIPTGTLNDAQGNVTAGSALLITTNSSGTFELKNAGGWSLTPGTHTIRLSMRESGTAVDSLQLAPSSLAFSASQLELDHKPNYFSVMNGFWISPAKGQEKQWFLDYSRSALPPIRESSISETAGLGWDPAERRLVYIKQTGALIPSDGPADWNNDGYISPTPIAIDLTGDGDINDVLVGYDDWAHIQYVLGGYPSFDPGVICSRCIGIGTADGDQNERDLSPAPPDEKYAREDPRDGVDLKPSDFSILKSGGRDPSLVGISSPNDSSDRGVNLLGPGVLIAQAWIPTLNEMGPYLEEEDGNQYFTAAFSLTRDGAPAQTYEQRFEPDPGATGFMEAHFFNDNVGESHESLSFVSSVPAQYTFRLQFLLYGDANLDYKVDLSDFGVLKERVGKQRADWGDGNFNLDQSVDLTDFGLLKKYFGTQVSW